MDVFERKVLDSIERYHMLDGVKHCVCGVSGGADSVSLLTVLARYRKKLGIQLHVVHINHMIRGAAADGDQRYVENLCRDYGVDCAAYNIDVQAMAAERGLTVEEAGRIARYDMFGRVRAEYAPEGCVTAVAHNCNDVAETVIFNIARGTGIGGVKGITPVRGSIIRPLLECGRPEIEAYLDRQGIAYCTDATNNEDDYTRNRIRHMILPVMEEINSQAVEHICAMARNAGEYERLANDMADNFLRRQGIDVLIADCGWSGQTAVKDSFAVSLPELSAQDRLVQELVIRHLIGLVCGGLKDIGRSHVAEVRKLYKADTGAGIDLPGRGRVYVQYGQLVFAADSDEKKYHQQDDETTDVCVDIDCEASGKYENRLGTLTVSIYDRPDNLNLAKKEYTKFLDYDKIGKCLQLRTFVQGDHIVVNSSGSNKKLNRLFTDCKIPADVRQSIPLVASGSEIVWAIGVRIGENYKVTDNTQKIIEMRFDRRKQS